MRETSATTSIDQGISNASGATTEGISEYALAKAIGVTPIRINQIIKGKRAITPDTALRLAAYLGMDAQSWINLQTHYDLEIARESLADTLAKIQPIKVAA